MYSLLATESVQVCVWRGGGRGVAPGEAPREALMEAAPLIQHNFV